MTRLAWMTSTLLLATATTTVAQTPSPTPTDSPPGRKLEEVTVTAQRRSESLQRVPISLTAVTAGSLEKSGITDTQSLAVVTPGLQLNQGRYAAVPYMRGVGTQNVSTGDEGATAVYVDGILFAESGANVFALNNIERVEVLRGPQGTLFGRNAVGGLINVITKDPSQTFGGNAEIGYGNYSTVTGTAYVTGPVSSNIAADLAVFSTDQGDGWGKNFNLGNDVNRVSETAVRSKVLARLGDATTLTVAGDYARADNDIGSSRQPLPGTTTSGGGKFVGSIYDTTANVPIIADKRIWGASARLEHELSSMKFQSTSAYRFNDLNFSLDSDGTALRITDIRTRSEAQTFQQEFLLTGSLDRLDWTTGIFYFYSDAGFEPLATGSSVRPPINGVITSNQKTSSYSGFAQGTYGLTDTTKLTLGLRYTRDQREIYATQYAAGGNALPPGTLLATTNTLPDSLTDVSFSKPTWRLALDHQFSDEILAYVSVSRGFKSGVFGTASPFAPAVKPETLDAYEIGMKADLLDASLRVNVSLFHYDYKNIQLSALNASGAPQLLNAAASKTDGADGDVTYILPVPVGELQVKAGFSVLDAKYSSFPLAAFFEPLPAGGNRQFVGDATDRRSIYAPKFTSILSTSYDIPLGTAGTLGLSATWAHNDGFYWDPQNRVREPAYDLVSGQVSLTSLDEKWRLRLYGKNLLDKEYYVFISEGSAADAGAPAPPRTYGLAISRTF